MVEKFTKNLIAIAIIIAGVLIAGAIFYVNQKKTEKISEVLTAQQAAEKVINFINQNLLEPGMTASLINAIEERGLYKITFKAGEEQYDSYVTKDGKILFFGGIDMDQKISKTQATEPEKQTDKEETQYSKEQLESLAKCLKEKGAKFYGAYWCGWCKKQKEIFGEAAQYLPYIECVDEKTQQITSQCQEAGIQGYPTWEINGQKRSGFKKPKELAELSGCPL